MRIGVPAEIKNREFRVAMTPAGVNQLTAAGHHVMVQKGAGVGSHISDDDYAAAGATMVDAAEKVWGDAELVVKVKEPVLAEYGYLRDDLVLFTYLHRAADRPLTQRLLDSGCTAVAYETVQLPDRSLPLLAPMSEIAGRLAPQVGAYHLMAGAGGRGVLLGGVPGVTGAQVVVLGGGVSGRHAAEIALGMRAHVTVLDVSPEVLRHVDEQFDGTVTTVASTAHAIAECVTAADLVIGAVLIAGARAPHLVSDEMVAGMRPGAVLVDIAVDQGGCFENTHATTHDEPTYRVHDAVFYCVANMPGAVPRTSTFALTNATLKYVSALAGAGWRDALQDDPALAAGLQCHAGTLTNGPVGAAHGLDAVRPDVVLAA
jgi:alanine dehydrogenase